MSGFFRRMSGFSTSGTPTFVVFLIYFIPINGNAMNNKKQTTQQNVSDIQPRQNGFQGILVPLACVSFFPAVYVIGKTIMGLLG